MEIHFLVINIISVVLLMGILISCIKRNSKSNIVKLDKYTTKFYTSELDKIIMYKTIYYIDSTFGKSFSLAKNIDNDIPNDSIYKALELILEDIHNTLSIPMKNYLVSIYGEVWLTTYIKTHTLSLLLNYTKYTLNSLTIEKFS